MSWIVGGGFALVLVVTVCARVPVDHWFFTGSDYFRVHLAVIGAACLAASLMRRAHRASAGWRVAAGLVAVAVAYHVWWIAPFTSLAPVQSIDASTADDTGLSLLVANVHRDNDAHDAFADLVRARDPDLVAVLEPDAGWCEFLECLGDEWVDAVEVPLDNTYGMALYSKRPLLSGRVEYLVRPDVPSIHARLDVDGRPVDVIVIHPRPPTPDGAEEPAERDAELMIVARLVRDAAGPAIVVGDLNAVAWSPTTRRFQELARLLDPRVGRGFYSTWHARWPLLRFPIDHVFHSEHFGLAALEVLDVPGSDHRAMSATLLLSERAQARQDAPDASADDRAEARETIRDGRDGDG